MAAGEWTEVKGSSPKKSIRYPFYVSSRLGICSSAVPGATAIPNLGDAHPDDSALDAVLKRTAVNVTIDEQTVPTLFLIRVDYRGVIPY